MFLSLLALPGLSQLAKEKNLYDELLDDFSEEKAWEFYNVALNNMIIYSSTDSTTAKTLLQEKTIQENEELNFYYGLMYEIVSNYHSLDIIDLPAKYKQAVSFGSDEAMLRYHVLTSFYLMQVKSDTLAIIALEKALNHLNNVTDSFRRSIILISINHKFMRQGQLDSANTYYEKSLPYLGQASEYMLGKFYNNRGIYYANKGDFNQSLVFYNKSAQAYEKSDLAAEAAYAYGNAATIYARTGKITKALECFVMAKKKLEVNRIANCVTISTCFRNISHIYLAWIDSARSSSNDSMFQRCIYMSKTYLDSALIALKPMETRSLIYHANVYELYIEHYNNLYRLEDMPLAGIKREGENNQTIKEIWLDSALFYVEKLRELNLPTRSPRHQIERNLILARLYQNRKEYKQALKLVYSSYPIAITHGLLNSKFSLDRFLYNYYSNKNNVDSALLYLQLIIEYNDSIYSQNVMLERGKLVANLEHHKEMANKSQEQRKLELEAEEQAFRNNIYKWSLGIAGIGLLFLLLFIRSRLKISRKQNSILDRHYKELDEKNRHITQSIQYAERIQAATMPSLGSFKTFFSDVDILFKPKDIVSGNFYWFTKFSETKAIWAVADGKVHGVPGGFMSMIGASLLNKIILEYNNEEPGIILDKLRQGIVDRLNQTTGSNTDNFSIILCSYDKSTGELKYCAANLALSIIRQSKLIPTNSSTQPIGIAGGINAFKSYETSSVNLLPGDLIYMYTDGFHNQINQPTVNSSQELNEMIVGTSKLSFDDQLKHVGSKYENLIRDEEQVTDFTFICVKI